MRLYLKTYFTLMKAFVLVDNGVSDLTSQITKHEPPVAYGSFGDVYRCTISTGEGTTEVAVKVFKVDKERFEKGIHRELKVWLKLKHPTIVPLLGVAFLNPPFPALISQWIPSGTLRTYLGAQAMTLTAPAKGGLAKGVADGLNYLHSEDVVHGDLHPGNVLIDASGNPCLTDFGLATVVGDTELQWTTTTASHNFDPRWRAPEAIGIDGEPERPTFQSDIYSFGSVMFFIASGNIPWQEKRSHQICIELSKRTPHVRPDNILGNHWNLVQKCWSWNPEDRPGCAEVLSKCGTGEIRPPTYFSSLPELPDLTGQIWGTIGDHIAAGAYGNVYRCEWRRPTGSVKIAVKVIKSHITETDLRRLRREVGIWSRLVHENIVPLVGTTEKFGPLPSLVSLWFPHGTLLRLITEQGAGLNIRTKLNLLHDIASGLNYLHDSHIVHGDITSCNILVDIQEGEYKACLTDFGLSTVLGGPLNDRTVEGSTVRYGAIRWTAPELLQLHDRPADVKPTAQNDMYSFGRVMFHVFTLRVPWDDIDDYQVFHKILARKEITRPEILPTTRDITDARWNVIELCWSVDPSSRPSALMAMDLLRSEPEALTDDHVYVARVRESHERPSLDMAHTEQIIASRPMCLSPTEVGYTGSPYEHPPWPIPSSDAVGHGVQLQAGIISTRLPQFPLRTTLIQPLSPHNKFATTSTILHALPLIPRPRNVLIFGETGVGKSSIINLIMGRDVAQTSPDAPTCTLEHTPYEISLENRRFKLWDVSSTASMGFFRRLFAKWRMKKTYKKLYSDDGVYLLLYCIRNSRAQGTLVSDYKLFTSIVGSTTGRVPVAAVVTCLEDYPTDMDDWWKKNECNLEREGLKFSKHACITALPDDPDASSILRARRQRSAQIIRHLICESYQTGRIPVTSRTAPIS
ncbi:kinase-like protein [Rhizopogon salebrosus TDB-379]|nr:kinase-like protein [Rhizopogon salebrosus TDB-379]